MLHDKRLRLLLLGCASAILAWQAAKAIVSTFMLELIRSGLLLLAAPPWLWWGMRALLALAVLLLYLAAGFLGARWRLATHWPALAWLWLPWPLLMLLAGSTASSGGITEGVLLLAAALGITAGWRWQQRRPG